MLSECVNNYVEHIARGRGWGGGRVNEIKQVINMAENTCWEIYRRLYKVHKRRNRRLYLCHGKHYNKLASAITTHLSSTNHIH